MFCDNFNFNRIVLRAAGIASFLLLVSVSASPEGPPAKGVPLDREHLPKQDAPTKFIGVNATGDPVYMPLLGAGTWQYDDDEAYESLCKAFGAGYTFVDTAYGYKNQKGVGRAIRDCWKGNREDLFVLTKIPGE